MYDDYNEGVDIRPDLEDLTLKTYLIELNLTPEEYEKKYKGKIIGEKIGE